MSSWADCVDSDESDYAIADSFSNRLNISSPARGNFRRGSPVVRGSIRAPRPIPVRGGRGRGIGIGRGNNLPIRGGPRAIRTPTAYPIPTSIPFPSKMDMDLDSLIAMSENQSPMKFPPIVTANYPIRVAGNGKLVVVHNFAPFSEFSQDLEVGEELYNIYQAPSDQSTFEMVTILGAKFALNSSKSGDSKKKMNIQNSKNSSKAQNRKLEKFTEAKQKKTEIAKFRQNILETTSLICATCGSRKPFRSVRHLKGKREFRIVPFKDSQNAVTCLVDQLRTLLQEKLGCSSLVIFGNKDISEQVIKNLTSQFPGINFSAHLSQENPRVCTTQHGYASIPMDSIKMHAFEELSEYLAGACELGSNKEDFVYDRVIQWLKLNSSMLSKDCRKFENQISSLLKFKLDDGEVRKLVGQVIPYLNPHWCSICKSFFLYDIRRKQCELRKSISFGSVCKMYDQPPPRITDHLQKFLENVEKILSAHKDPPATIISLCKSIEGAIGMGSVDFRVIFSRLQDAGIVRENEEYLLEYNLAI